MALRLTPLQLSLVSAIVKSPALKRALIAATATLAPGTRLRIGERTLVTDELLGSGLIGVVYGVTDIDSGEALAYKRPRARLAYFREALELERQTAAALLARGGELEVCPVLAADPRLGLLKRLERGATLARAMVAASVTPAQREALLAALRIAGRLLRSEGLLLDLSPKNLCWRPAGREGRGAWVLLDAGPKVHKSSFSALLDEPSWRAYATHFADKLAATGGASEPSALSGTAPHRWEVRPAGWAFLRGIWRWFPLDDRVDRDAFLADVEPEQADDEVIYLAGVEPEGGALVGRPHRHAPRWLAEDRLVQRLAIATWPERAFPEGCEAAAAPALRLEVRRDGGQWLCDDVRTPLGLEQLAAEVEGLAFCRGLRQLAGAAAPLPAPTLRARSYGHWSDLALAASENAPLDLFCHEPLPMDRGAAEALVAEAATFHASLPTVEASRFGELHVVAGAPASSRGVLLVPGFRAAAEAALPLAQALRSRGVDAHLVAAYLGVRSADGGALVSAGRFEAPLLLDAVDYMVACLGVERVTIIAASQGVFGAVIAAQHHPWVDSLVLDTPLARPLGLVEHFCRLQGRDFDAARAELAVGGLLERDFELPAPSRRHLRTLVLRRDDDRFVDLCGALRCPNARELTYRGAHAQTMRHDTVQRGVPDRCAEAIAELLRELYYY